jgi:hypothetical protein
MARGRGVAEDDIPCIQWFSARCGVWSPSPLFGCVADSCTHNGSEPLHVNELIVDHTPITFASRLCSRMNIIANPG